MNMTMPLRALIYPPMVLILACGSAATPVAPSTLMVGEANAGKTVHARVGDTIRVKLQEDFPVRGSSLIWDVSTSAPSVLRAGTVTRDPSVRPPTGHVAYTADFAAVAGGQAQLIARGSTTCEAMAKPGCPNRNFMIAVVVS